MNLNKKRIKTMPRTNFGKTRPHDNPYAIYSDGKGWEVRVLKTYQHSSAEKDNGYARWFVSATSPMMHGGLYEYGDQYCREILWHGQMNLVSADHKWFEEYGEPRV